MSRGGRPVVPPGPWLAVDTATSHAAVGLGDGTVVRAARIWATGRQHGETLLAAIDALLRGEGLGVHDVRAVVVGTGPGAFTGLRVGLATAKTLAHGLRVPIVGVPTPAALARAAMPVAGAIGVLVVQPAGPHDRYVTRVALAPGAEPTIATPRLVPAGEPLRLDGADTVVAVDLAAEPGTDLTAAMIERGRTAVEGLAGALLAAGGAAFAAGRADEAAELVPLYVSLPRGVPAGGIEWSPDLP